MFGYEIEYGNEIVNDNGEAWFDSKKEAFLDALSLVRYNIRCGEWPEPMRDRIEIGIFERKEN